MNKYTSGTIKSSAALIARHHSEEIEEKVEVVAINTNKTLLALSFLSSLFLLPSLALAHCPLCTAATGAAVVTARWYGVDDLILGTFIGGFTISTAIWFNNFLRKRNKNKNYIPYQSTVLVLASLVSTILTFYYANLFGNSAPKLAIFGIDKLFLGTLIGSAVTLVTFRFHDFLRNFNGNKNFLPFQVIVLTLAFLVVINLGFYFVGWI